MSRPAQEAADELETTLLEDLIYSRIFDVQDDEILQVLELTGDRQNDYLQYRSLGNRVILDADLKEENGRLALESRIYDLQNYRPICKGKRFRGQFDQARRVAHTYNDQVVECFSGQPGIALSQIVFASDRAATFDLNIMNNDGTDPQRISEDRGSEYFPSWALTDTFLTSGEDPLSHHVPILHLESLATCPTFRSDGLIQGSVRNVGNRSRVAGQCCGRLSVADVVDLDELVPAPDDDKLPISTIRKARHGRTVVDIESLLAIDGIPSPHEAVFR